MTKFMDPGYAVWRQREANTPELVAAFRHRDHAEQWGAKMYATSEVEVARLDDDAAVQEREPRTADSSCKAEEAPDTDRDLEKTTDSGRLLKLECGCDWYQCICYTRR